MRISDAAVHSASVEVFEYLRAVARSGRVLYEHFSGGGAVAALEEKLRRHYGIKYAVCVSNATTGLLAIGLALGLRGKRFVTTPYTFGASLAGMLLLGNEPDFADVDPTTLTLSTEDVKHRITRSTAAVLAVDADGNPNDMQGLRRVADEHGIWYIADAAQSLGARRNGLPASSLADALVVSFTCGKTVFAGEGGAVLTNNKDIYERLIWHSQHPDRQRLQLGLEATNEFGLNARIHPLAAIWANAVFEDALHALQLRQEQSLALVRYLNTTGLTESIPFEPQGILPSFFRLTAAWKEEPQCKELEQVLKSHGLEVDVAPHPVRLLYQQPSFHVARRVAKRIVHCPIAERQALRRFLIKVKKDGCNMMTSSKLSTISSSETARPSKHTMERTPCV